MRGFVPEFDIRVSSCLDEALNVLAENPGMWRPLAGGTDIMVELASGRLVNKKFLDISRIVEIKKIKIEPDFIILGALTSFTDVYSHEIIHKELPNLMKSARATGALAIQNRGTIGGNIVNGSPAADTPPALLAYGAEVELSSVRGSRWLAYEGFHLGYKRMDLASDELLTRIRIPRPNGRGFHFFRKVGTRRSQAISKLCLSAYAKFEGDQIIDFRAGLGAVAPVPTRARCAEAMIRGKLKRDLSMRAVKEALLNDISPIDDIRSTANYRRIVMCNVFEQMLRTLEMA